MQQNIVKSYFHRQADIEADRHTDKQEDIQIDRNTDGQTDRQTDKQTDRETERQTHRQTDRQDLVCLPATIVCKNMDFCQAVLYRNVPII